MTDFQSGNGWHDFAFQTGTWRVRHRKLNRRLAGDMDWLAFDGECSAWEMLNGAANVDDHLLNDPIEVHRGASLRRYDPVQARWSIWWWDSRLSEIGPPVHGSFQNGIGTFSGVDRFDGQPIIVRFIWSEIMEESARWEQAFSADNGTSWEVNWIMHFERHR